MNDALAATTPTAASTALPDPASLTSLAALGKVAFALLFIVGLIVLCAWLARRLVPGHTGAGPHLKVIAGKTVGPKEKVVIVEVSGTWLVLGVAAGSVNTLHKLPARAPSSEPGNTVTGAAQHTAHAPGAALDQSIPFSQRFAAALRRNLADKGHPDRAPRR